MAPDLRGIFPILLSYARLPWSSFCKLNTKQNWYQRPRKTDIFTVVWGRSQDKGERAHTSLQQEVASHLPKERGTFQALVDPGLASWSRWPLGLKKLHIKPLEQAEQLMGVVVSIFYCLAKAFDDPGTFLVYLWVIYRRTICHNVRFDCFEISNLLCQRLLSKLFGPYIHEVWKEYFLLNFLLVVLTR